MTYAEVVQFQEGLLEEVNTLLPPDLYAEKDGATPDGLSCEIVPLGIRVLVSPRDEKPMILIRRPEMKSGRVLRNVEEDMIGLIAESIVEHEVATELAIDRATEEATRSILGSHHRIY